MELSVSEWKHIDYDILLVEGLTYLSSFATALAIRHCKGLLDKNMGTSLHFSLLESKQYT